ncbi:MAG: hypothetical protein QM765_19310 [Myxococcales bacterium]
MAAHAKEALMEPMYLEIVIEQKELARSGVDGDAIERAVEQAVERSKMGALTGGGSGTQSVIIEVELFDEARLDEGLALLRSTLRESGAPAGTVIKQLEPELPHPRALAHAPAFAASAEAGRPSSSPEPCAEPHCWT